MRMELVVSRALAMALVLLPAWRCAAGEDVEEVYRGVGAAAGTETSVPLETLHGLDRAAPKCALEKGEWVFDNGADATRPNGAVRQVVLNQSVAQPFTMSVESRCEVETGGSDSDYSLYLDITYADGGKLYGQKHPFRLSAKRGWQKGVVTVNPDKPVKSVACYLLFRRHAGRARFRDLRLRTYPQGDYAMFDATPVQVARDVDRPVFLLHDAAADGDGWTAVPDGATAKGLRLSVKRRGQDDVEFFDVSLTSASDADRAVTFAYSVPLPAGELVWLDDPRTEIAMGSGQHRNTMNPGCGEQGLSRWPFGAVRAGGEVRALGFDPDAPAIFRVVGNGRLRRLFIAFDLGFTREMPTARFKFVSFRAPGEHGFRGALARYARIFPDAYKVRIKRHGIWMAFAPISKVEGWEDFGFRIKEGDGETAWDDAHGILTFHYTEPTSWWMSMKATNAVTLADAMEQADRLAASGHAYARAWKASTYHDEEGQVTGRICDAPWCKGACWNMNALPGIPGGDYQTKLTGAAFDRRHATELPAGVDGEYVDSAECHLPPRLDFRRENFRYSRTPLCWSSATKRPGVTTALSIYEYVRAVADRMHARGRLVQANGVPYSWPWLIPFVDMGGQETKWIHDGEGAWNPQSDRDLLYRTAMSYGKPYCFLQNVKFENMTDEMVEKYFHRCLAYGLMSSFFSPNASGGHYFSRPELYNRHRPFFKKYGPLQRMVSEAGWRPVGTLLRAAGPGVFVEQFGDDCVTVWNSSDKTATAELLPLSPRTRADELVAGGSVAFPATVSVPPETVRLYRFAGK